jgi:hypothetical protein
MAKDLEAAKKLIEELGLEMSPEELLKTVVQPKAPRKLRKNEYWDAEEGKIKRIKPQRLIEPQSQPEPQRQILQPIQQHPLIPQRNEQGAAGTKRASLKQVKASGERNKFELMGLENHARNDIRIDKALWGENTPSAPRPDCQRNYVAALCRKCNKYYEVFSGFISPGSDNNEFVCDSCLQRERPSSL